MSEFESRILVRTDLSRFRRENGSKSIAFTNGCFDILHRGHVTLLSEAKGAGDLLVVGLNSDQSARNLKGPARPLMPQEDRAFMLLQLRPVDYVTIFDEETPIETIMELEPDVLVKGAEYGPGEIVGEDFVEGRGGRVIRVEMVGRYSTSEIIDKIKEELRLENDRESRSRLEE
jgi:D-beta-D-heptose 7-phosphate kinase/D-beta-D-heptose 1-phosphate adenosyltransferase